MVRIVRAPPLDLSSVSPSFLPDDANPDIHQESLFGLQEAPTFRPTPEEFVDPLAYISSIRAAGEKCGILKIIPPEGWKPDFSIDTEVPVLLFLKERWTDT